MKPYIKVFLSLLIVSVFCGCSATKLSKYDIKETYSEKQVLVYDKTINLPTRSYISNMQFSPINKDEIVISLKSYIDFKLNFCWQIIHKSEYFLFNTVSVSRII